MTSSSSPLRFAAPLDGKVNFCYHIKRFSTLDMKPGEMLESSSQTVETRGVKSQWTLVVYPGEEDTDFLSVYLDLGKTAAFPLKSKFTISIVQPAFDCDSVEQPDDIKMDCEYTFTELVGMGALDVRRSALLAAADKYIRNDTLTIAVDATITFDGDERPPDSPRFHMDSHLRQLGSIDFDRPSHGKIRCWDAESGLLLGTVSVHCAILCAVSKTFEEMFDGKAIVDVDDTTLVSLRRFIHLIYRHWDSDLYTGALNRDELLESASDLLHLANRFGVETLKTQLDGFLATRPMTAASFAHLLPIAETCAAQQLMAACKDFFKANCKSVIDSDAFHPKTLSEGLVKEMFTLANMFPAESEMFHDCVIRVLRADGVDEHLIETIPANRLILCRRSAVFKAKFDKNNDGLASPSSIDVDQFSATEMRRLLSAMIGDGLDDESLSAPCMSELGSSSAAERLLSVAHFYQVDDLVAICERHLSQHIDLDNVFRLLKSADRHSIKTLKGACISFIRDNAAEAAVHSTFPKIFDLGIPLFSEVFLAIAN